jgi:HEPN domain-containing protein
MHKSVATASGFVSDARDLLEAAEYLNKRDGRASLPSYFLLGRALELGLKAFLLLRGMKSWTLSSRDYGHDLTALLGRATKLGLYQRLKVAHLNEKVVELLNREYISTRLGYRVSGDWYRLPVFGDVQNLCDGLVSAMEVHLADTNDDA